MPTWWMSLAQSRQGDKVMYNVAPSAVWVDRASLVMALASAWSTYQWVVPSSVSQTLGKPLGVPL